jgi:hypothetical protein
MGLRSKEQSTPTDEYIVEECSASKGHLGDLLNAMSSVGYDPLSFNMRLLAGTTAGYTIIFKRREV